MLPWLLFGCLQLRKAAVKAGWWQTNCTWQQKAAVATAATAAGRLRWCLAVRMWRRARSTSSEWTGCWAWATMPTHCHARCGYFHDPMLHLCKAVHGRGPVFRQTLRVVKIAGSSYRPCSKPVWCMPHLRQACTWLVVICLVAQQQDICCVVLLLLLCSWHAREWLRTFSPSVMAFLREAPCC